MFYGKISKKPVYRVVSVFISILLVFSLQTNSSLAQMSAAFPSVEVLSLTGNSVGLTPEFQPLTIKGITFYPDNALKFDFLIDQGDTDYDTEMLKKESEKLVQYFLASLTVPEEDKWVNLTPGEDERIVSDAFGKTQMGWDVLAQDYLLKQLLSSLLKPEKEIGKDFWDRINKMVTEKYGTVDIPVDIYSRVWIVPDHASIFEDGQSVYVINSRLKVLSEKKFMEEQNGVLPAGTVFDENNMAHEMINDIIIPEIEREVNHGQTFANLRQIYNSMILASWFKDKLKDSVLGQGFVDQQKIKGVELADQQSPEDIYQLYLDAVKSGVYSMIREDYDPLTKEVIPRQYFSGGADFGMISSAAENFVQKVDPGVDDIVGLLETVRKFMGFPKGNSQINPEIRKILANTPRAVLREALEEFSNKTPKGNGAKITLEIVPELKELSPAQVVNTIEIYHPEAMSEKVRDGKTIVSLNCGSSSAKFAVHLVGADGKAQLLVDGNFSEIGKIGHSTLKISPASRESVKIQIDAGNHQQAIIQILDQLKEHGITSVDGVGHRVVHGGDKYSEPVVITAEVKKTIEELFPLAPLHNPANLTGITAAQEVFPDVAHVAIFDTAFHARMPRASFTYAIPRKGLEEVRRYGFHGTSFNYIMERLTMILGKDQSRVNAIIAHLGNGASMAVVRDGISIDTTMGLTPLEGLMMGTRSGDIDPGAVEYIANKRNMSLAEVVTFLNKDSGLKGISGTNEMNVIRDLAEKDPDLADSEEEKARILSARIAVEVYFHRIKKYIGAYMAELNMQADAVVFTAGIGENEWGLAMTLADELSNMFKGTRIMIIPTNEEVMFARQTNQIIRAAAQEEGSDGEYGGVYLGADLLKKEFLNKESSIMLPFTQSILNSMRDMEGFSLNVINMEVFPPANVSSLVDFIKL